MLVETIRGRVNGLEVKNSQNPGRESKTKRYKPHKLKVRRWELEGYRRYVIKNFGICWSMLYLIFM